MNIQNVRQITGYEIKMLSRDWGFRFIVFFCVVLIAYLHVTVQGNIRRPVWIAISLSSAIPYANAYLVNYLQVLIAIFIAGRFIRKGQQTDTNSALDMRPFSNVEYLWGKVFGFMITLLLVDVLLALVAVLVNLLLSDAPFALYPYVFYLLTLTIPSLVFITGLVVCVKGLIRVPAVSLLVLLAIFALLIIYAPGLFHGAVDMFALSLPNVISEVTGFAGWELYGLHRLSFLLWGGGLLTLGILSIHRVSNSQNVRKRATVAGVVLLLLGMVPFFGYMTHFTRDEKKREAVRAVFVKYDNAPKASVKSHDIRFEQKEDEYTATSRMTISNAGDQSLGSIILYLNPGLQVTELTVGGEPTTFDREGQVIVIPQTLEPGEEKRMEMHYGGTILPEVCFPEVELASMDSARVHSIFKLGKDYFYLRPDFTVLTPECMWYPTSLPTVNLQSPYITRQNYTRFSLAVTGEQERTPVSQGVASTHGDTIRFTNAQNLTGISLSIGNYTSKSIEVQGKRYEVYVYKGHEFLIDQFSDPSPIIERWIMLHQFDNKEYVFDKLALVETPVHFCTYNRYWKMGSEYVQPEMVFRPEREALMDFPFQFPSMEFEGQSPEMATWDEYLRNFNSSRDPGNWNLFFGSRAKLRPLRNEYDLAPLEKKYHFFTNSSEFPGINLIFEGMQMRWRLAARSLSDAYFFPAVTSYFNRNSLEQVWGSRMTPEFQEVMVWMKSDYLLKYLLCYIPYHELQEFTEEFLTRHAFQEIRYEDYCREVQDKWGVDLLGFTRAFYAEQELPAFRVGDVHMQWVETGVEERGYVESVKVWNIGKVDGIITLAASRRRNTYYLIPAGTCKEIRSFVNNEPDEEFRLQVQTNLSQNMPSWFTFTDQPEGYTRDPRPGVFDADTTSFLPPKGEYIVDDSDPGFHIVKEKQLLDRSDDWSIDRFVEGYGDIVRTYHSKSWVKSMNDVGWKTELPENGSYELFVYVRDGVFYATPPMAINGKKIEKKDPVQTYFFKHVDGEEKVTLEMLNCGSGWVSLGKYEFAAGPVEIRLSGKGADEFQLMYADAVKWVKID